MRVYHHQTSPLGRRGDLSDVTESDLVWRLHRQGVLVILSELEATPEPIILDEPFEDEPLPFEDEPVEPKPKRRKIEVPQPKDE